TGRRTARSSRGSAPAYIRGTTFREPEPSCPKRLLTASQRRTCPDKPGNGAAKQFRRFSDRARCPRAPSPAVLLKRAEEERQSLHRLRKVRLKHFRGHWSRELSHDHAFGIDEV